MDTSQVTIETERLRLVPVTTKYTEQIFLEYRLLMTQYMNHTSTGSLEELKKRHKKWEIESKKGIELFMAVLLKKPNEFLGCFSLENMDQENPEMGGWLKKSAHGRGYGREAAAALKQWADQNLHYDHIIWPCVTMNTASRKLAESLGGKIHRKYEKKTAGGTVWPALEYWIFKNDEK